jgi:hypothetical protein
MTSQSTCARQAWLLAAGGMLLMVFPTLGWAQQSQAPAAPEEGARALWDSEFLSRRPATTKASRPTAPALSNTPAEKTADSFLGVTVWRLRRSRPADEPGIRLLAHGEQRDEEWTPERIEIDTPLADGQKVRISIETAQAGYLYVIEREQYAGGTLGDPYLIFPTLRTRGGDNRVVPGALVEIPAWDDDPPYLTLHSRPEQIGEVLTVLVTPHRLPELRIGDKQLKLASQQVAEWEKKWGAQVKRLEARQQVGKPYTPSEKEAGAGKTQLLTPADPAPQTLFRVDAQSGDPVLIQVPLRIRK